MSKPPPNNNNNNGPPVSEAPKDAPASNKPKGDRSYRGRGRCRGGRFQPYQHSSSSVNDGVDLAPKPPEKPIGASKAGPTVGRSAYMGYPRKLRYTVYCSNAGTRSLVSAVWRTIQDRDPKMAQRVTGPQLLYVVNVAFINRLVRNAVLIGYGPLFNEASRLKQAAEGIILPAVLCDYIESLGTITMASSATVVPWVDVADRLYAAPGFISLRDLLQEGGRRLPPPDDAWGLDKDWIDARNEVTSRPASKSMHMRTILWSTTVGSITQLVTPTEWDPFRRCTPSAIQNCYNHELQLGATYQFRSYADAMAWPGDTSDIAMDMFRGEPFEPDSFWSQLVVASFRIAVAVAGVPGGSPVVSGGSSINSDETANAVANLLRSTTQSPNPTRSPNPTQSLNAPPPQVAWAETFVDPVFKQPPPGGVAPVRKKARRDDRLSMHNRQHKLIGNYKKVFEEAERLLETYLHQPEM